MGWYLKRLNVPTYDNHVRRDVNSHTYR